MWNVFTNMGGMFEMVDCFWEIKLGNAVVEQQHIQGSKMAIEQKFIAAMEELGQTKQPYRLRIYREFERPSEIDGRTIRDLYEIKFGTHSYIAAFPDEFKN